MNVGVGHTLRSNGLLRREACLARVYRSGLKTIGGATSDVAHDIITEIASS
jgi:hypothetical protein